jgi:hypothetical protein
MQMATRVGDYPGRSDIGGWRERWTRDDQRGTRLPAAVVILVAACAISLVIAAMWLPSVAAAQFQRSDQVAIVQGEGAGSGGPLQVSGTVAGSPGDSFDQFTFSELLQEEIEPSVLSSYDTVVLNEVFTNSLSEAQKQTLANFITTGGKLIIHDADGTAGNEYSWLPVPAESGHSCQNCGNFDGEAEITENNTIVSNDPSSPFYVDVNELPGNSDAAGDANVLVTTDPRWDEDIRARNQQNVEGAADAYASDGGLIMYNGFDTDFMGQFYPSGNDWLDKIWYDELTTQWNPDSLPHSTPVVGAGGHCGYRSMKVGAVLVCAEAISTSGTEATASGNVVLDGGVAVGDGPLQINRETKQISLPTPASISLLRNTGPVSLGTAAFSIDANPTTDQISGKTGLARVSLTGANLAGLGSLRLGKLPFSLPTSGSVAMYLDSEQGGGLVGAGTVQLPMVGKVASSGAASIGLFAGSQAPASLLGGSLHFGALDFGKGWSFTGLDLTYQQPSDTWTASGGLSVPIGSLSVSGSVVHGGLESLHVAIGGQDVPLGDSGFFFTGLGGGVAGLANGPLKISASTEGFWGVPKSPVEPFYLDNLTVTVDFGGSVSLDGAVSFALKDHSPLHGQLHLKLNVHPFSAHGSASLEGEIAGASFDAHGGAGFTTKHFTAAESGELKIYGLSGKGQMIVSDKGLGASGTLCAFGHFACQTMALAGTWRQIGSFDLPSIVGGNPQQLITVSGVTAANGDGRVHVPRGQKLLLMAISGSGAPPNVLLASPGGKTFSANRSPRTVVFMQQPAFGLTTIAILRPRAGVWRISNISSGGSPLRVRAQTVRALRLIKTGSIAPRSSRRHPLKKRARVLLHWTSSGLPGGVRVTIVRHAQTDQLGVGIAGNLPATGHVTVPASKLAPGRNTLTLAATLNGVPFQQVAFHGTVWREQPRHPHSKRHRPAHKH